MCPLIKCSSQEDVHLDYQNHWPGQWTYSRGYKLVGVTQITVEGTDEGVPDSSTKSVGPAHPEDGRPTAECQLEREMLLAAADAK